MNTFLIYTFLLELKLFVFGGAGGAGGGGADIDGVVDTEDLVDLKLFGEKIDDMKLFLICNILLEP